MLPPWDASRNRMHVIPGWQRWMLAPSDASTNRTLYQVGSGGCSPHRMLLGTARCHVGSGGCLPHRMLLATAFPGWQRWMLATSWQRWMLAPSNVSRNRASRNRTLYQVGSDRCSPHRMLLATARYQVGSGGCSPHRMLLATARYDVGKGGCLPHRMLLGTERYPSKCRCCWLCCGCVACHA